MKKNNRVGEKFISIDGEEAEIVEYFSAFNCTLMFKDGEVLKNIPFFNVKNNRFRRKKQFTVFDLGFVGHGKYSMKSHLDLYKKWYNMMRRCYSKASGKLLVTYEDVTVCKEWHNFQNFAQWFEDNYDYEKTDSLVLDKDILIKGNKVYGPDTCCFVPNEVNMLFIKRGAKRGNYPIGVYKRSSRDRFSANLHKDKNMIYVGTFKTPEEAFQAYKVEKEKYIKEIADKWKGVISDKVYQAMYNYKVEITD